MDGRIEELLGGFGVEAADEFGGVFEVGKEHGDLLAFALQGGAGREDLVGEMGRRVGEWRPVLILPEGWWRGGCSVPSPDQYFPLLIDGKPLGVDDLLLEGLQGVGIQGELELERPGGNASSLSQEFHDLVQHCVKFHPRSSLWP
jgi:hypothetical protein